MARNSSPLASLTRVANVLLKSCTLLSILALLKRRPTSCAMPSSPRGWLCPLRTLRLRSTGSSSARLAASSRSRASVSGRSGAHSFLSFPQHQMRPSAARLTSPAVIRLPSTCRQPCPARSSLTAYWTALTACWSPPSPLWSGSTVSLEAPVIPGGSPVPPSRSANGMQGWGYKQHQAAFKANVLRSWLQVMKVANCRGCQKYRP
jgi:hypothetical protein